MRKLFSKIAYYTVIAALMVLGLLVIVSAFSIIQLELYGLFTFLVLFSLPILGIALFLVIYSFGLIRRQKKRIVGLIRTRGLSSRQVFFILMVENFLALILSISTFNSISPTYSLILSNAL